MKDELDAGVEPAVPVWAVFGDLMSVMLGAFVLVLVGVIAIQLQLSSQLQEEIKHRQEETQRRITLEQALAQPLADGRVTLINGRIGISGSVLFALNSAQLQAEGQSVLESLIAPLHEYLQAHDQVLMVSGFTDDRPIWQDNRRFADNWELSAQRALTVTRALVEAGVPPSEVFAAAFGAEQPVASNDDEQGRARNRRVEIVPVPRPINEGLGESAPSPADAGGQE
ncbi:OmpA family protein [Pusillimonas sp. CC-YST705]|uniref:OmpA family protein n=1 Tax=Mesopusillimonas faecipullorum TaxID=2755040 RepID=A0ABS8CDD7_9BURK|nr:OmpA family protein [Mesopusillimonas faecipullorum]MCB5364057.1 OmpA family protein [Mesopusillimonas faecipullorum]